MTNEPEFPEAELTRLADGSLPPVREAELRAQLERSPRLASALAEQERAISMVRSADAMAPASLRREVEAMGAAKPPRRRTWPRWRLVPRWRLALPAATALAGAIVAVILLAGGSGSSGPSLPQTAQLALASVQTAAPAEDSAHTDRLSLAVDGVSFPYWGESVGWRTLGVRTDTIAGRRIVTVFYSHADGRVGYAIVPGAPVAVRGGTTVVRHGIRFTLLTEGQARLVTWLRSDHTCVIAGRAIGYGTLLSLATADLPRRV